MLTKEAFEYVAVWADLGSLFLLTASLLVGGLTPSRLVYGRSVNRNLSLVIIIVLSLAFTIFRFIAEGIFLNPGPREFLVGNVVYLARWLWLWWKMNSPSSTEKRLFDMALALRDLHSVRVGFSTDLSRGGRRKGKREIVVRRGVKKLPPGPTYWRGVKETKEIYHKRVKTWEVRLVEQGFNSHRLDSFGTMEYMNVDKASIDAAYKTIYDVVLSALPYRQLGKHEKSNEKVPGWGNVVFPKKSDDRVTNNGTIEVNFNEFFERWPGIEIDLKSQGAGAIDERPIGWVARRVAADATVYVMSKGKSLERTRDQITVINRCVERAVRGFLVGDSRYHETVVDMP